MRPIRSWWLAAVVGAASFGCDDRFAIEGRVITSGGPFAGALIYGDVFTSDGLIDLGSDSAGGDGRYRLAVSRELSDVESVTADFYGDDEGRGNAGIFLDLTAPSGTHRMPDLIVPVWSASHTVETDRVVVTWTADPEPPAERVRGFTGEYIDTVWGHLELDRRVLLLPLLRLMVFADHRQEGVHYDWHSPMWELAITPIDDLAAGAPCTRSIDGTDEPWDEADGDCPVTDRATLPSVEEPMERVTIDLGRTEQVSAVSVRGLREVAVVLVSDDGANFTEVATMTGPDHVVDLEQPLSARYVRLAAVDGPIEQLLELGVFE